MPYLLKVLKAFWALGSWRFFQAFGCAPSKSEIRKTFVSLRPYVTRTSLIRVGPAGDGGYLIPDELDGITDLYSPGVGEESGFERFFADRGVICHLIDGSVDGPAVEHRNFRFRKIWLRNDDEENSISLGTWVEETSDSKDLGLQMDIEGDEYAVLESAHEELLQRFRFIVIEFHGLHKILTYKGLAQLKSTIGKLSNFHDVVHVHPNSCCPSIRLGSMNIPDVCEVTFLRRSPLTPVSMIPAELPNPLDVANEERQSPRLTW